MEITKNGGSALAALATGVALALLDFTIMAMHPEWMMAMPEWFRSMMPSLVNVFSPVIFLVAGLGTVMVLRGDRRGYVLLIIFAIGGLLTSILTTYWRLSDQLFQGAVICAVQIVSSVAILYFATTALQEKRVHEEKPTSEATTVAD